MGLVGDAREAVVLAGVAGAAIDPKGLAQRRAIRGLAQRRAIQGLAVRQSNLLARLRANRVADRRNGRAAVADHVDHVRRHLSRRRARSSPPFWTEPGWSATSV